MAILAECPMCHRKQATKNRLCKCGEDLVRAKRSKKVRYWINYLLPNGKQRREAVGFSVEDARDAEAKRRSQKREMGDRFYEVLQEDKFTFRELAEWYLSLQSVKRLSSCDRYEIALNRFNEVFGDKLVKDIKAIDIENYQAIRGDKGILPKTIDHEVGATRTMLRKADDNDMIDPRSLKAFKRAKKLLKQGENARDRVLTLEEYRRLLDASAQHTQAILTVAMNTGMRKAEILGLRWSHIDRDKWMIRLPAELTKERKPKSIPINSNVRRVLEAQRFATRSCDHDFVFVYEGKPMRYISKAVVGACRRADIPYGRSLEYGFVFHDIRRTVKTYMTRAGVEKAYRDVILGHSLRGMDVYYLKPSDEDLHSAMEKYTAWLETEIANVDQTVDQAAP